MRSRDQSASISVAPAAKYSAIPRPIPWAAPVTMTTLVLTASLKVASDGGLRLDMEVFMWLEAISIRY
jgi:hypothetical protein